MLLLSIASTPVDCFIGVFVIAGAIFPAVALNHQIPRPPKLRVEYRNPDRSDRPEVWKQPDMTRGKIWVLQVYVVNDGDAEAEAIVVEFSTLESHVKGKGGGLLDTNHVHVGSATATYGGNELVLPAGEALFMAQLHPRKYDRVWPQAIWNARARGMKTKHGEVLFDIIDPPV